MIGFCILTVVLSAYAALPKIKNKRQPGNLPAAQNPSFNLLFFGSFSKMDYPEFKEAMAEVMNNHNQAYEVQIREIYLMGRYLERSKYRFVRLAYLSFIAGVTISAGVYMVGFYL